MLYYITMAVSNYWLLQERGESRVLITSPAFKTIFL